MTTDTSTRMPALYIGHGAPPLLDDALWSSQLAAWAGDLPRPKAILIVSAHWESAPLSLTASGAPLVYDFGGFAPKYYRMTYETPDATAFAKQVAAMMPRTEPIHQHSSRGLDHGAWVPLKIMYPQADIPVLQMSMPTHDPGRLMEIGRRLKPLRDEGVLIIGSGMSFHNLRVRGAQATQPSMLWDEALTAAVTDPDPASRAQRVAAWADLPHARFAHPREEHLLPLMVALGAGGEDAAVRDHASNVLGWAVSGYRFG